MLTFDLGTSSAHPHHNSAHKEDHTRAVYETALYVLSHPYFTKGSVACALVGVVLVYTVWLIRSTLRRIEATSGEGGGGGEGTWQMSSTLLKGHTQVRGREGGREGGSPKSAYRSWWTGGSLAMMVWQDICMVASLFPSTIIVNHIQYFCWLVYMYW